MAADEDGPEPAADLDGLDELLAWATEPLGDGDDDPVEAPVLYVPPSRGVDHGGGRPLPVDTSRLADDAAVPFAPAAPEPAAPDDPAPSPAVVERPDVADAAEVAVRDDAASTPAATASDGRPTRGPRWHPPPVKAPPPSAPLDLGPRAPAVPPAPVPPGPDAARPAAGAATPADDRRVPERPAHPRVRRWFGRDRGGRAGDGDGPEPASGER